MTFIASDVPRTLRGDPGRIAQVLLNLIGNAIKFTDAGQISVSATLEKSEGAHSWIYFSVQDTGIGVTEAVGQTLFRPFTQADSSTSRKYGGTGLGLSISKQLVELMGGKIGVKSHSDAGSEFWFSVPLANSETAEVAFELKTRHRILVFNPLLDEQKILSSYLRSWNFDYEIVRDFGDLINRAREPDFELILVDQGDDREFFAKLRTLDSETQQSAKPVLVTSRSPLTLPQDLNHLRLTFLVKPLKQSTLFDALLRSLGERKSTTSPLSPPSRATPTRSARRHRRVLLVEDNTVNQIIARTQLETLGLIVETASNGHEALRAYESHAFDLILMDCQMPEMDGYQATQALRGRETSLQRKKVPVIALTANAMSGDEERCRLAGMDDYLAKPFHTEQLEEILNKWLPT